MSKSANEGLGYLWGLFLGLSSKMEARKRCLEHTMLLVFRTSVLLDALPRTLLTVNLKGPLWSLSFHSAQILFLVALIALFPPSDR